MVKNSYSVDWGIGQWHGNEPQKDEDVVGRERGPRFQYWGSADTFNLNRVLLGNVQRSNYFKELASLTTFKDILNRMVKDVKYVTPWEPGTHKKRSAGGLCSQVRGVATSGRPTSAFTFLVKLMTFRPTARQIQTLLDYEGSPYVRAIGFLFVRYCCDPERLWEWMSPYFDDDEPIQMQRDDRKKNLIGKMVRDFLEHMTFFETYFYRIPSTVHRKILHDMKEAGYEIRSAAVASGSASKEGDEVEKNVDDAERGGEGAARRKKRKMPYESGSMLERERLKQRKKSLLETTTKIEKRIDPFDGKAYTRVEFFEVYGGYEEWKRAKPKKEKRKKPDWLGGRSFKEEEEEEETSRVVDKALVSTTPESAASLLERRVDPADGNAYTRSEFVAVYGGVVEWDRARPSIAAASTKRPKPAPPSIPPPSVALSANGAREVERRVDPSDGLSYTKAEFYQCYGSLAQWDAAKRAGAMR